MRLYTSELVKKYKARTVVNHVSIDVNQGEIVGLLGPNGAGKTTTFYMIVGLIKPNAGKIFLENDQKQVSELTDLPVYRRAQLGVGYLAQEASVFRRLSVEDNIRAVLEMTSYSKEYQQERVEALIEEFRLQKVRKSLGIQLSGGERRRTEIARAVAINPAFILLDEPFAGVDPIAVEDIQSIVATLKHKNIGVIITDHNVDETLAITDRTYLLYEGKILKTGTAEELAADPMVRKVYLGQHFELKKSHQLTQEMKNRKGEELQREACEDDTAPTGRGRRAATKPRPKRTGSKMDRTVRPGRVEGTLTPPCSKATHSAPWPPRSSRRVKPCCATSNSATTPARPCTASKHSVPKCAAWERTCCGSAAGSTRAATGSRSANRGWPHGSSPPWPRSAAPRSRSRGAARCSAARWG